MFGLRTSFFQKTRHQAFQHRTNATCREGRWTGEGKNVFPRGYRVFLVGDRREKCLGGDRQRTVWCLQQHQRCYLRNRRTKCALTVSCRRPGKLGCRSNSPSLWAAQATSHVSSELCTFRCLLGHVCQRCGPVSRNTVGTMVDVCQVMVAHTIICKIQASRLSTLVRNESRCSCSCTEILALLTMKLELLSPLLSDSPFLSSKVFLFFRFSNLTVEWTKWNHACWGPRKLSILNSFLVFPRPVNFAAVEQSSLSHVFLLLIQKELMNNPAPTESL